MTGAITAGGSTNDATPTLAGTAEANSTISIFDGTTLLGTTTADASGNWTFTPTTALTDGSHSLTATVTDAAGNVSTASSAFPLTVDTAAPAAPVLNPTTGTTLSGTAEAGSTISLDLNGDRTPDATVTADASATGPTRRRHRWPVAPSSAPPPPTRPVTSARLRRSLWHGGEHHAGRAVISTVTDDVAPVTGAITAGGSTNDATPTLTGTAEATAPSASSMAPRCSVPPPPMLPATGLSRRPPP
ncbi:Ig-like domain-containing protein [Ralstonia pseudosolanacearum]|uniref:Ig-like domain-containing protein n=1 Tax=Ralstonia pseudosolanacearum TaxID=1310165 RepID=UPI002E20D710